MGQDQVAFDGEVTLQHGTHKIAIACLRTEQFTDICRQSYGFQETYKKIYGHKSTLTDLIKSLPDLHRFHLAHSEDLPSPSNPGSRR